MKTSNEFVLFILISAVLPDAALIFRSLTEEPC
jgi:hypothetical protein